MTSIRLRLGLLLTALTLVLTACPNDSGPTEPGPELDAKNVTRDVAAGGTLNIDLSDAALVSGASNSATFSVNDDDTDGEVTLSGAVVTYVAPADAGEDSFDFTVTDGDNSDTATVTINVTAAGALTATDTSVTVEPGEILPIELAPLVTGDNAADATFEVDDDGTSGTVVLSGSTVTYTAPAEEGTDTFTYTATAGEETATGTITITVDDDGGTTPPTTAPDGSEENPFKIYNGTTTFGSLNSTGVDLAGDAAVTYSSIEYDVADDVFIPESAKTVNGDTPNFTINPSLNDDTAAAPVVFPVDVTFTYTVGDAEPETVYFELFESNSPTTAEAFNDIAAGEYIQLESGTNIAGDIIMKPNQVLVGAGGKVTDPLSGLVYIVSGNPTTVGNLTLADGVAVGFVDVTGAITGTDLSGDVLVSGASAGNGENASVGSVNINGGETVALQFLEVDTGVIANGIETLEIDFVDVTSIPVNGTGIAIEDVTQGNVFNSSTSSSETGVTGISFINSSLAKMTIDASVNEANFTAAAGNIGFLADIVGTGTANSLRVTGSDNTTNAATPASFDCEPQLDVGSGADVPSFFVNGVADENQYGCRNNQQNNQN